MEENNNNNSIGNIQSSQINDNIVLKSSTSIFAESFYFTDIYDETLTKKFIKGTERLIRQSHEYTTYIATLRANINPLNYDCILSNISTSDADLEFHHYPFSLYDIIEIVLLHHIVNKERVTTFSIAKEVMQLHYEHRIGLVPLSTTMHELAHLGSIFLSERQIFGDWKSFKDKYRDGISQDALDKIKKLEEYSNKRIRADIGDIL